MTLQPNNKSHRPYEDLSSKDLALRFFMFATMNNSLVSHTTSLFETIDKYEGVGSKALKSVAEYVLKNTAIKVFLALLLIYRLCYV